MEDIFRCYYIECNQLLTTEFQKKGCCPNCGGNKFRAIRLKDALLSDEEKVSLARGEIYVLDTDKAGPSPDILNYTSNSYWKRVKKEVGKIVAEQRREEAKLIIEAGKEESNEG